ncbi:hypothetical protein AB0P40_44660, partial [Streptomyces sp. NPDC079189]
TVTERRNSIFTRACAHLDAEAFHAAYLRGLLVRRNHFKQLNDRHGHAAGDTALAARFWSVVMAGILAGSAPCPLRHSPIFGKGTGPPMRPGLHRPDL